MANIKSNFICKVLLGISQIIFSLITFPYASRILLPEGIGEVSFIDNLTQYFTILSALGIPIYGIREVAKRQDNLVELQKLLTELISIHFIASIISGALYWTIVIHSSKLSSSIDLCQIGLLLILSHVFVIEWFYQGLEKFKFIVIRTLLIRVLTILLLFLFVKTPQNKSIYYILNFIGVFVGAATALSA